MMFAVMVYLSHCDFKYLQADLYALLTKGWLHNRRYIFPCLAKVKEYRLTYSSLAPKVQRNHLHWRFSFQSEAQVSVFWAKSYCPRCCPPLLG